MARASTPTLLALDEYAKVMGLAPAHFNQGWSSIVFPINNACSDIWFQYDWQHADSVSREELADAIQQAEEDIADALGWWPAPIWIAQDVKMYPRHHRPDVWRAGGANVRGAGVSIKARYGKIIEPGQRAVSTAPLCEPNVDDLTLEYLDWDHDGYPETVRVTCTDLTVTDVCEIKVYFDGHNGDPEWEIRPARTKTLTGGTFVATFWKWQFIDPDHWEEIPAAAGDQPPTVNLDTDVYVDEVDVYREYNDPTAVHCRLYWEPSPLSISGTCSFCGGTGCTLCQLTVQDGCVHIRDAQRGTLVPVPGSYDADEGAWASESWSVCRDPDQVKLYYYCGDLSWRNLRGDVCDPLSNRWKRIIAGLATSRLDRPICACGNVAARFKRLQTDYAYVGRESGTYNIPWDLLSNPFGTRVGEVEAWKFISRLHPERQQGAGAVP